MLGRALATLACVIVGAAGLSCAGVGGAVGASCATAAITFAAEGCADACVSAICDDDVPAVQADTTPVPEVPPADAGTSIDGTAPPEPLTVAACRKRALPGGTWRLDCADGTFAEALSEGGASGLLGDGDAIVKDLGDVAALADRRAVLGGMRVTGNDLLRVQLPTLRHVAGDLRVEGTVILRELRAPHLHSVGRAVRVTDNRALRTDPAPALTTAQAMLVSGNDALPTPVVDRLMSLAPPQ